VPQKSIQLWCKIFLWNNSVCSTWELSYCTYKKNLNNWLRTHLGHERKLYSKNWKNKSKWDLSSYDKWINFLILCHGEKWNKENTLIILNCTYYRNNRESFNALDEKAKVHNPYNKELRLSKIKKGSIREEHPLVSIKYCPIIHHHVRRHLGPHIKRGRKVGGGNVDARVTKAHFCLF
jgi:hypothetical protein